MNGLSEPLIVGAGPVGLGAALFLQRAGISTRIIDAAEKPSTRSRALAVNPRTLEILEPTGVTEKMLALGLRVRGARFWRQEKMIGELTFDRLEHKYPFMLALSQATTERLLTEALEAAGGRVERGTELVIFGNCPEGIEAKLKHESERTSESVKCPWLLAADGAHSTARHVLHINFKGSNFIKPWHLADLPLKTALDPCFAHGFLCDNGFVFLIRVIDDAASLTMDPPLWRVFSNRPELLKKIPMAEICGSPVWESEFHISHRINEQLQDGHVYFAGDAAHVHSPLGARGMNLGLEDAWAFSELVKRGQMKRYATLRQRVDEHVVNRVKILSRMMRGESVPARMARSVAIHILIKLAPFYRRMATVLTGLDHPLEPRPRQPSHYSPGRSERHHGFARTRRRHAHSA